MSLLGCRGVVSDSASGTGGKNRQAACDFAAASIPDELETLVGEG
jgi:hypothetical protein